MAPGRNSCIEPRARQRGTVMDTSHFRSPKGLDLARASRDEIAEALAAIALAAGPAIMEVMPNRLRAQNPTAARSPKPTSAPRRSFAPGSRRSRPTFRWSPRRPSQPGAR